MNEFETNLNKVLVETFNNILKFEAEALRKMLSGSVTVNEAHMIEAIGKSEDNVTVSQLAGIMNISVPTTTIALKKLEKNGYVNKVACTDDGRKALVGLTDKGKTIDRAHRLFHNKMVKNISSGLSEIEKNVLLAGIKKLNSFFQNKVAT